MLTHKQRELLNFIEARVKKDGVAPSFDEMREAVNLKSKSGIHRLITALEERGFIRRLPHRARALEVCHNPTETPAPTPRRPVVEQNPAVEQNNVEIPLYGRIAAGTPIEALQESARSVAIPPSFLGQGEHYALEVSGDSMIEAGIMDGDTVIIRRCDTAENGSIVVALIEEDNEATLKRLYRRGKDIALEPANPAYETRVLNSAAVKVQGQLVGLLRQY